MHDVLDHLESPTLDDPDLPTLPGPLRVETEKDLVGKAAFIAYEDSFRQLASVLVLPIPMCPYTCKVLHVFI